MAKEKDPAFLFYSKDWVDGTAYLTAEEKGVYIDLIVHHHQHSGIPNDLKKLARICRMNDKDFLRVWGEVKLKFFEENGMFYNKKMLEVTIKRKEKSVKNTVIGTFASILRLKSLKPNEYEVIKKSFKCEEWLSQSTECLTERLTEWIDERLKSIANANIINNSYSSNTDSKKKKSKELWEFLCNSKQWIDPLIMKHQTSRELITLSLKDFFIIQNLIENPREDAEEVKKHFANWLKTNPPKKISAPKDDNPAPWTKMNDFTGVKPMTDEEYEESQR